MLPTLRYCPLKRSSFFLLLMTAMVPLATWVGRSLPAQDAAAAKANSLANPGTTSILSGRITDDEDKPIAAARVRLVVPSADLRFVLDLTEHREVWTSADRDGRYNIEVPGITKETIASIDILDPGHRRLVGTLMSGGSPNVVDLLPGKSAEFDAKLKQAWYFAGQVVNEVGDPIEGVAVNSSLCGDGFCAGVERSATDSEGRFAVYGFTEDLFKERDGWRHPTGSISFHHDHFISAEIEKLEDLAESERTNLKVVMQKGHSLFGQVTGVDGKPAADLPVCARLAEPFQFRYTKTDDAGRYRLDGLKPGHGTLRIVDVAGNQKAKPQIKVQEGEHKLDITLQAFDLPIKETHQVLGMTLADVTPAIDEAYDLRATNTKGVMIVDPGKRFADFEVGELRPGYVFWMVGNDKVENLRAMLTKLVEEAKSPTIPPGSEGNTSAVSLGSQGASVRVVWSYDHEEGTGTNTQYMKLTQADILGLEEALASMNSTGR